MCAAGTLRGVPASRTTTRRRARPSTSAALRPAAPPPMIATSEVWVFTHQSVQRQRRGSQASLPFLGNAGSVAP
jgi:hypothetical protein